MDDVEFTGDEAALANRITSIDTELDAFKKREETVLGFGLRGSALGGWAAHQAEDALDRKKAALLTERADLVEKLKTAVADNEG